MKIANLYDIQGMMDEVRAVEIKEVMTFVSPDFILKTRQMLAASDRWLKDENN